MKSFSLLGIALLAFAAPAFGNVTVTSPASGAQVTSPFRLSATATACSSQTITAMGYSLDNSSSTTVVNGASVNAQVAATIGAHTLRVKSWGNKGASCVANVAISVVSSSGVPAPSSKPSIPPNAIAVKGIQALQTWRSVNDTGAGSGTSNGTMALLASPSLSGVARQFAFNYTNSGAQRYYVSFGADKAATNFLYDGWIYVADPSGDIANVELDMNQVIPNGQTVIYGFQCDGYSNTWDYTVNAGSPQNPIDRWIHSTAKCNPRDWSTNAWHHVQISYSRDAVGNVTYKSVWFDGVQQDINATVPSAFALGWGSTLLTNFQIDGYGRYGSATMYLDSLTIYRW